MKCVCIGVFCLLFGVVMMIGCEKKLLCEFGELDVVFKEDLFVKVIFIGEDVIVCKVSDGVMYV